MSKHTCPRCLGNPGPYGECVDRNPTHTPGPWLFHPRAMWTELECITDSNGQAVARTNNEANAHLIAAAPDLLEVCKTIHLQESRTLETRMTGKYAGDGYCKSLTKRIALLSAAIAKAEGRNDE